MASFIKRLGTVPLILVLLLAVVLIAGRAVLPFYLEQRFNRQLSSDTYDGQIQDVDLALWHGAMSLENIRIKKKNDQVEVPFLEVSQIDFSIDWSALLNGWVVAEVHFQNPEVHYVAGPTDEQSQAGPGKGWIRKVQDLWPIQIDRLTVDKGRIHFQDFHSDPRVNVVLDEVSMVTRNLTNVRDRAEKVYATTTVNATLEGHAPFSLFMEYDPLSAMPRFDLDAQVTGLDLSRLNDFFRAYANVDVNGTAEMYLECAVAQSEFDGYLKPIFHNFDVLQPEDVEEGPLGLLWEGLVAGAKQLFTSEEPDARVGTRIPLSGTLEDPEPDILTTVIFLLKNGFIEAVRSGLEGQITFEDTADDQQEQ